MANKSLCRIKKTCTLQSCFISFVYLLNFLANRSGLKIQNHPFLIVIKKSDFTPCKFTNVKERANFEQIDSL